MTARYLVRFDDICPTMNWRMWDNIEGICKDFGIKPLLAVVPDNHDPQLRLDTPAPDFWERVRKWQALGWTIGLHGFRHQYINTEAGMLKLNPLSEFAGLSLDEQRSKINCGIKIFEAERVRPDIWIAPSHSFDANTLIALKEAGITAVSDGYFLFPHLDPQGTFWLPQQIWRFRPLPLGVWTVCFHHNPWTPDTMAGFRQDVSRYRRKITDFGSMKREYSQRSVSPLDTLMSQTYVRLIQLKKRLNLP